MSIILGIDPGTTTVGFAFLRKKERKFEVLDFWVIETEPKIALSLKLLDIIADLEWLIEKYRPEVCGIEKLFFLNNQKTGIDVAQARWAIVHTLAKKGIRIVEYTPLQVKRGICWNGSAVKAQVQNTLKMLFNLDVIPKPDDAADALAIAYITGLQNYNQVKPLRFPERGFDAGRR